jgi:hypothetical protein
MKRMFVSSVILASTLAAFSGNAGATEVQVDAQANSVVGGTGLNTGVNVRPGQLLTVTVDRADTWRAGPGAGRVSNANGLGNPLGQNFGQFTNGTFSFLFGSLVGSLDGGTTFFPVGTRLELSVLRAGTLTLYYWDSNSADNNGRVRAIIQVYDGSQQ